MSQIDKLNYLPLLFWFIVFFSVFYFLLFVYILPLVFGALRTRSIFFYDLIDDVLASSFFICVVKVFYENATIIPTINFISNLVVSLVYLQFFVYRYGFLPFVGEEADVFK